MKKDIPFKIIKRVHNAPNHCEVIDIKESRIKRPTLLCLGGNTTKTEYDANAMCKIGENLIGRYAPLDWEQGTSDDVDILGVAYGAVKEKDDSITRLVTAEIESIAQNMLEPLLFDDSGKPLVLEEAMQNFNMLTIFSYCYGTVVLNCMSLYLQEKMQEIGFSQDEAKQILGQITCVAYAPFNPTYAIPTLEIKSCQDETILDWLRAGKTDKDINGIELEINKNNLTLWSSQMANGEVEYGCEHPLGLMARNQLWQLENKFAGEKIYAGKNADAVSQVAGYTLAQSIANSMYNRSAFIFVPKPTLEDMYSAALDIINGFTPEDLSLKER